MNRGAIRPPFSMQTMVFITGRSDRCSDGLSLMSGVHVPSNDKGLSGSSKGYSQVGKV
jgi:hypothetical protein